MRNPELRNLTNPIIWLVKDYDGYYRAVANITVEVTDLDGLNLLGIKGVIVALVAAIGGSWTPTGYIISPHDEWHVKVVGYQLVGYFNVKKDDVELIDENNDGAYERAIINGTFTLRDSDFAPPNYSGYETKTWSNWTSLNDSLYLAIFVVDSDGNEAATLYKVWVKNGTEIFGSSTRTALLTSGQYDYVVSSGILSAYIPEGDELVVTIDSEEYPSGRWPSFFISAAAKFEIGGMNYSTSGPFGFYIPRDEYSFTIFYPKRHGGSIGPKPKHQPMRHTFVISFVVAFTASSIIAFVGNYLKKRKKEE